MYIQVEDYLRYTLGASVEEFPLAPLRRVSSASSASSPAPPAVCVKDIFFRWLCKWSAITEEDVAMLRRELHLPDEFRFPAPRGYDTRVPCLREAYLDTVDDMSLDRRTRERLVLGFSPKWTLFNQILFPFIRWQFNITTPSTVLVLQH